MADQPHELSELEQQLQTLEPKAARIDRDGLMYAAGQTAARVAASRKDWGWRVIAALLLAATIVQSGRLEFVEPRVVERIVYSAPEIVRESPRDVVNVLPSAAQPTPAPREKSVVRGNWIGDRNLALSAGIEAIAAPRGSRSTETEPIQTLGQLRSPLLLRDAIFNSDRPVDSNRKQEL